MKRLLSITVMVLFVISLIGSLTGCVSGGGGGAGSAKGKDLTIVAFTDIGIDVEGNSFYEAAKHYEETTGGKVHFRRYSPSLFITKMITLIGSNKSPDLVYCRWAEMPKLAAMDILQPVDDYISTEETNFPKIAEGYNFQGEHYALRIEQVLPYMMWYNKSILQEYGCDDPYTVWKNNPDDWDWEKFDRRPQPRRRDRSVGVRRYAVFRFFQCRQVDRYRRQQCESQLEEQGIAGSLRLPATPSL